MSKDIQHKYVHVVGNKITLDMDYMRLQTQIIEKYACKMENESPNGKKQTFQH